MRVLLLARSAGEWRDRLAAGEPAVRELLAGAGGDEPLAAAVSGELSNAELVAVAVPVFAMALGVPVPSPVVVEAGRGRCGCWTARGGAGGGAGVGRPGRAGAGVGGRCAG